MAQLLRHTNTTKWLAQALISSSQACALHSDAAACSARALPAGASSSPAAADGAFLCAQHDRRTQRGKRFL